MWTCIVYTIFAITCYTFAEYFAKLYANDNANTKMFLISAILYFLCTLCWFPALSSYNKISILSIAWGIFYMIAAVFVGCFVFHEALNAFNIAGIILAMIACVLLCL